MADASQRGRAQIDSRADRGRPGKLGRPRRFVPSLGVARRRPRAGAAGTLPARILRFGRSVLRSLSPSGLRSAATPRRAGAGAAPPGTVVVQRRMGLQTLLRSVCMGRGWLRVSTSVGSAFFVWERLLFGGWIGLCGVGCGGQVKILVENGVGGAWGTCVGEYATFTLRARHPLNTADGRAARTRR
jgi:hypothetical protein